MVPRVDRGVYLGDVDSANARVAGEQIGEFAQLVGGDAARRR
jgi:hypothetical protein